MTIHSMFLSSLVCSTSKVKFKINVWFVKMLDVIQIPVISNMCFATTKLAFYFWIFKTKYLQSARYLYLEFRLFTVSFCMSVCLSVCFFSISLFVCLSVFLHISLFFSIMAVYSFVVEDNLVCQCLFLDNIQTVLAPLSCKSQLQVLS